MKLKELEKRVEQYFDEDNEHDREVAEAFRKLVTKYRKLRDKKRAARQAADLETARDKVQELDRELTQTKAVLKVREIHLANLQDRLPLGEARHDQSDTKPERQSFVPKPVRFREVEPTIPNKGPNREFMQRMYDPIEVEDNLPSKQIEITLEKLTGLI